MISWRECSCCSKKMLSENQTGVVRGFPYAYERFDDHFILYHGKPHKTVKVFDNFDDLEMFVLQAIEDQIKVLRRTVYRARKVWKEKLLSDVMDT